MGEDGKLIIEVPYLPVQLLRNHFENMPVQHESFFTLYSLKNLIETAGLHIQEVFFVDMDGGSVVVSVGRHSESKSSVPNSLIEQEKANGFLTGSAVEAYAKKYKNFRSISLDITHELAKRGPIVGFGAGSKGQVICNALGIGSYLDCVLDEILISESPRFIPGSGVKVINPSMLDFEPNAVLITASTHARAIFFKLRNMFPKAEIYGTSPQFGPVEIPF